MPQNKKTRCLVITGGVCSSLGKGLTAASIGYLLERKGLTISLLKLDPYLNVDPGTMNPFQHGEVYVTDDGAETDLDLGHYFRFTHSPLSKNSNTTSGQVYNTVLKRERRGDYLGNTVQVIPHITDEIKRRIYNYMEQEPKVDLCIIEIGGTIGDIESLPFLEAIRQLQYEMQDDYMNIHLTHVPFIKAAGELKTKPTQHSVQALRAIGIFPDSIVCRSEVPLDASVKEKISLFCQVKKEAVIEEVDVKHSIYELPIVLQKEGLDSLITKKLALPDKPADLSPLKKVLDIIKSPKGTVTIGVIGKYVAHQDAYKSVFEALYHGAIANAVKVDIRCFEADKILDDHDIKEAISGCDGYLVPGGFGERGWHGKIKTARYCRENSIPYFGICLGMQVLTVEFARNVAQLNDANSTEVNPSCENPVISLLSEQKKLQDLGGTMRLGANQIDLKEGSVVHKAYQKKSISERHRHRYEFNNDYKEMLEKAGLLISGVYTEKNLCECVEIKDHPFMVGVQYHPEFKSKPTEPHPLFTQFIKEALESQ